MNTIDPKQYNDPAVHSLFCGGDTVTGDEIVFVESVFGGSFRKPTFRGYRRIIGKVVKDSYGADRQQHTFTIAVEHSDGIDPVEPGKAIRRKGRNVYKNGTWRKRWANEAERDAAADEKHARGDAARAVRDQRRLAFA